MSSVLSGVVWMRAVVVRFATALSGVGLLLGTLFFAASLTPTLVPRTYVLQGLLAGISFATGYGLGVMWRWLWAYMELPEPGAHMRRSVNMAVFGSCMVVAGLFLWQAADWQNSIRVLMEMEPVDSAHPLKVCILAIATFVVLLGLARLFGRVADAVSQRSHRYVPRRLANVLGLAVAAFLFWSLASGVFFRGVLLMMDSSYRQHDALIEPSRPRPESPYRSGSEASLMKWGELGRAGREFIASGPSAADISTFTGRPALEPIRVYAGLRAAESPQQRARLALRELIRMNAFERSVLVVITPTGTGWVDPAAMDPLEYLHDGDVASVAVQYSYLSSPLSLIVEPEYGVDVARALFVEIYEYWTRMPKDKRPRLYLHGLSLGTYNSERSAQLFEMIADPIDGAVWSGPTFQNWLWRSVTVERNEDSPAWLPEFHDGSLIRFMNQDGSTVHDGTPWGPIRVVYLQYASDPVTFFDPKGFYRPPAWMVGERGPDVSPELRWYPIVTMLQLALDMLLAGTTPMGYGHVFAPEHYLPAWVEVTAPQGWTAESLAALSRHLSDSMARALSEEPDEETAFANRGG
ncbi:alpha/beta-hydrolase family protein [Achromobacter sp. F4_2707]|uniref:alpha/beta hydrolase n=1 Tax=Achromobacter sp. F4_2707 TaxID=3114286 RepID=UPI0039C6260D